MKEGKSQRIVSFSQLRGKKDLLVCPFFRLGMWPVIYFLSYLSSLLINDFNDRWLCLPSWAGKFCSPAQFSFGKRLASCIIFLPPPSLITLLPKVNLILLFLNETP